MPTVTKNAPTTNAKKVELSTGAIVMDKNNTISVIGKTEVNDSFILEDIKFFLALNLFALIK
jgi:hypothetical protein